MSQTKLDGEVEVEITEGLSDEEESLLEALDEVEQTIDAMGHVLASLREQLADHLQGRRTGPSPVLDEWPEDPEPHLH
ncbi:MAG: hypothetical protein V2J24_08100 [Pseudomonadales bacterium]|nr:hypothetical protein [Pseudomonadales bacterium]